MLNRIALSFLASVFVAPLPIAPAHAAEATVVSREIKQFRNGSDQRRFGAFEFLGGIEMSSPDESLFGAWSGIRLRPDGRRFVGILDTGHWISGHLKRDGSGKLTGLEGVSIVGMRDVKGRPSPGKARMDAESIALRGDDIMVGFEAYHRVDVYRGADLAEAMPVASMRLPFPVSRLRGNGGLEAMAVAPKDGPLKGAVVVIAEKSLDENANHHAGILDGPLKGPFGVVRSDDFDITDSAFLPNGDLLILQRRFSLATGVAMRIARIDGSTIRPGAVVKPEVLLHAASGYQIDNMEGIETIADPDGGIRVIIVSDDNHSLLQRNLMLEFRLLQ